MVNGVGNRASSGERTMQGLESWRLDLNTFSDRLALGLDLFGPFATWLWLVPLYWVIGTVLVWLYMNRQQRRSDRAYLDYASRQLPVLRRIARQRAQEVAFSRRTDRF